MTFLLELSDIRTLLRRLLQVHYGLYIEWAFATGGLHVVPMAAKRTWIALIVVRAQVVLVF